MRVLVTGATGLVGTAIFSLETDHELVKVQRSDYNLINYTHTKRMFDKIRPDAVIHLAARVGGVKGNIEKPADFFYENIMINTNVLHCAHLFNVKKVVSMLSTCIFPDNTEYPIKESSVHNGPPHNSNFAYSYAKRMLDVQSRAYRQQYRCNFITAVPNNLFGENDNFHLSESHVIPAMIRKFHDAVNNGKDEVYLWGDGSPLREFTYSKDIARQLFFVLDHYSNSEPINLGTSDEISIKEIAESIKLASGYKGKIIWDQSMPSGQYRKPSDKTKICDLGWNMNDFTEMNNAIKNTYNWYEKSYPHVRGFCLD